MASPRTRIRIARAALLTALVLPGLAPTALAGEICTDVFDPPTGMRRVCFDCNAVSLSAEQERICTARCTSASNQYDSMCYRRQEDAKPARPLPFRGSSAAPADSAEDESAPRSPRRGR